MSMSWMSPVIEPGMVVNQGRDRSAELRRLFGLKKTDKLVYLYSAATGRVTSTGRACSDSPHRASISWPISLRPTGKPDQFPPGSVGRLAGGRPDRLE